MNNDIRLFKEGKVAWEMLGLAVVWAMEINVEPESLLGSMLAEALAGTFDAHPNHGLRHRNALGSMTPLSGEDLRDLCEARAGLADFELRAASVRDWWNGDAPGLPPPSPEPKPPSRLQIAAEARQMSEELALTIDAVMAFAEKRGYPLPSAASPEKAVPATSSPAPVLTRLRQGRKTAPLRDLDMELIEAKLAEVGWTPGADVNALSIAKELALTASGQSTESTVDRLRKRISERVKSSEQIHLRSTTNP